MNSEANFKNKRDKTTQKLFRKLFRFSEIKKNIYFDISL